eukprot:361045_1
MLKVDVYLLLVLISIIFTVVFQLTLTINLWYQNKITSVLRYAASMTMFSSLLQWILSLIFILSKPSKLYNAETSLLLDAVIFTKLQSLSFIYLYVIVLLFNSYKEVIYTHNHTKHYHLLMYGIIVISVVIIFILFMLDTLQAETYQLCSWIIISLIIIAIIHLTFISNKQLFKNISSLDSNFDQETNSLQTISKHGLLIMFILLIIIICNLINIIVINNDYSEMFSC